MRRRILQSTLTVAVIAVLLLGIPLAIAAGVVVYQNFRNDTQKLAEQVYKSASNRYESRRVIDETIFQDAPEQAYIRVICPAGLKGDPGQTATKQLEHGIKPSHPYEVKTSSLKPDGTYDVINVTVSMPRGKAFTRMAEGALAVLCVALLAVLVAVLLGLRQANRLAEPLVDLAARARRLGSGHAKPRFARYDIEEVDRVADVLERSAERMNAMLAAERQFASDASHQLRTPLTALSMRIEEIQHSEDREVIQEEARIALEQIQRLAGTVDHLLSRTRKQRAATAIPLAIDDGISQQEQEWKPAFANAGRHLKVAGTRGLWATATPGGLSQIIATLLENSLVHGAGMVTVRTRWSGGSVVIEVGDEGPGVSPEMAPLIFERSVSTRESTGLGLALARDLAEADGGRLALVTLRPAVFALFLNAPEGMEPNKRGKLRKSVVVAAGS